VGAFVYAFSKSLHEFLKSPHAVIDPSALRAAKALALAVPKMNKALGGRLI
jgi:hypothetical protein